MTINKVLKTPIAIILKFFRSGKRVIFFAFIISAIILVTVVANGNSAKPHKPSIPQINRSQVTVQSVKDSRSIRQEVRYPALIVSQRESEIFSKASGTVQEIPVSLGDEVKAGDILVRIDDSTGVSYGTGFNAGAINQAKLASDQAASAYHLAQISYNNMAESAEKDIQQAEIALDQAETGESNTKIITDENLKTGQIAYETAKLATEQAKLALDNRKISADQSAEDAQANADLISGTAFDTCEAVLVGINNITGFDENDLVSIPYDYYLGFYSQSRTDAINLYKEIKPEIQSFDERDFEDAEDKVRETISLAQKMADLADLVKTILDKYTTTGEYLPQTSLAGVSLSGLQSSINGYQTQINATISQLTGALQALQNTDIGNTAGLDALEKAYGLVLQQEKAALQNLENLKSGSKSQLDQAGFSQSQAENQVENLKIKLDSQLAASKAQMESSRLQYENSLIALNSLMGNYQLVAPIDGIVARKMVSEGDTVNPGQSIMIISRTDIPKIDFFVDSDSVSFIYPGMDVTFYDNDNKLITGKVTEISSRAEDITKRFLIEAEPEEMDIGLIPGAVIDVSLILKKETDSDSHFFIPLSAIDIGQNVNTIYIDDGGKAKKAEVSISRIEGEIAEISSDIPPDTMVVVDGNKRLKEGDYLLISQNN